MAAKLAEVSTGAAMNRFRRAVVAGKFYPPHQGHHLLIDTALAQSDSVSVLLCVRPGELIDGELRAQWLREMHPRAEILLIDDRFDELDSALWGRNTIAWLGGAPDAVFASESYGEPYARAMGCAYVAVDPLRTQVPCSGTAVRSDCFAQWQFLSPPLREWFALRVCVLGAESTGTTTLAQALAAHYATEWVAEYGREYSWLKQQRGEINWCSSEFVHIAEEQNCRENVAARRANRVLIADTNSFATTLWHRRYMNFDSVPLAAVAGRARCDLYLLTGDEIPFVQDGLRDGEGIRQTMHSWFAAALAQQSVPWLELRGNHSTRLAAASAAIDARRKQLAALPDRARLTRG